jgi:hypothetical protein
VKPRHLVLGLALAGAAGLVLFGDGAPQDAVVEPVARPAAIAAAARRAASIPGPAADAAILRLQPRAALLDAAPDAGADAFATRNWTPPPPPAPPEPPPPAPVAPPLPFTVIGKSLEEGAWEVYLAKGERTYVVRNMDVVDGSYRVDSIRPPLMTLTYLPLGQVQQLNIGVFY